MTLEEEMAFNRETRFTPGQKIRARCGDEGKAMTLEEEMAFNRKTRFTPWQEIRARCGDEGKAMTLEEEMAFNRETRFTPGQKIRARCGVGCYLTEGKAYIVTEFIERKIVDGFRFPPYVVVVGDLGKPTPFHTHRFVAES